MLALAAPFAAAATARAQDDAAEAEKAVETGRRALRESNRYPWYDPQSDDLRRVDVLPDKSAESTGRNSQWQSTPKPPPNLPRLSVPSWFGSLVQTLLIIAGVALGGLLIWLLVWAFLKREVDVEAATSETVAGDVRGDVDRIENLPFQVKRPQSNLQTEAERNYREGNYREAIIYLYTYLLVQLDRNQIIRLTKGKTNRQYLREVKQRPALVPIFEPTMIAFEDVFFGDHELTCGEFENCWDRLSEFHRLLEQPEQAAA